MIPLAINLLRWNSPWDEIHACIAAVFQSDFQDFELIYMENFNPDCSSLIAQVRECFGCDPRLRTVSTESNLGYAGAHNRFFAENNAELLMVLNPDAILDRGFLRAIVRPFCDPEVAAATGKMLKPIPTLSGERILDGTGIVLSRSRRGCERGQLEIDHHQYDGESRVFAVSGTAAVYRKSALESIRLGRSEYFDTDFFAYWEDLDLSWRLRLYGYECVYVPEAVVEHGRAAGMSKGGVLDFPEFIRHHRSFPRKVIQWSWRNHLFAIIKNDHGWNFCRDLPWIVAREFALLVFLACFIPDALFGVPEFLRLLPKMLSKRRYIMKHLKSKVRIRDPFFYAAIPLQRHRLAGEGIDMTCSARSPQN
jgi:GT2 family glycosyltransferase